MKVTMIVNAECEDDFLRKVVGRRNILLNDTGRRQTLRLKHRLSDSQFDYCFISPLIRCFETAIVLVGDKCEIIRDERLIQREMGELEERPIDEYNAFRFWDYKLNKSDFGVESIHDLIDRCSSFVDYLLDNYSDKNILIVTHNEVYRALRHLFLNHKIEGNLLDGRIDNLLMEEFEVKKKN